MQDFFKYLTTGSDSREWGLFLNVAGKAEVPPGKEYPPREHPSGYYFDYRNGRILKEYQFNYITNGSGVLENEEGSFKIEPGTLMIIRKNQWHRYQPDRSTGWTEQYIGFDGTIADHFLFQKSVLEGKSIIRIGKHEELIDTYYRIFTLVQEEKPGFQEIASGMIINLLGYITAFQKQIGFKGKPLETEIQNMRFDMRKDILSMPDFGPYAFNSNVSVDYFRNMFKKYTGFSPYQYHLELKLMRAKELLLTTNKSIKEIAYELGFQSIHYFSRCFKKKVGMNPSQVRK